MIRVQEQVGRWRRAGMLLCLFLWGTLMVGCSDSTDIDDVYGERRGRHAASVNGTSVLATLYEQTGFRVYSWRRLSPKLDNYQVIAWFPDDFQPPTEEQRVFLEDWLAAGSGRTLVYVGRDYDACADYWRQILPQAPADQQEEIMRRIAAATAAHATRRLAMPMDGCFEWFTVRREEGPEPSPELTGDWANQLTGEQPQLHVTGQLTVPTDEELQRYRDTLEDAPVSAPAEFRVLLAAGKAAVVTQVVKPGWDDGQILVVNNGAFLLNLPLVQHPQRHLAGVLIRACGASDKVAFLESGAGGPPVLAQEPVADAKRQQHRRERVMLAAHWLLLGLLYCLCVWPILGRPKHGRTDEVADFGQHIHALGALLQEVGDRAYAQRKIDHYHQSVRHDSLLPVTRAAESSGDREGLSG